MGRVEGQTFWRSRLALVVGLLVFTVIARAISFVPSVINPDESVFALAAREVLQGHLPYLTLFDNKPVGSTLIIALGYKVLGQSVFTLRLLGTLCVWISAMLLALLAERGGFRRLPAFLCGLLYIAFASTMGGLATLTEIILTPFTLSAVLLLHTALSPRAFGARLALFAAAGLACGAAILVKIVPVVPGFAVAGIVLLLVLLRGELTLLKTAALGSVFAVSSLLPMLLAALVFMRAGALPEFLYSNFGFAQAYTDIHPSIRGTAQRLARVADSLWPLLILGCFGVAALFRTWRHAQKPDALLILATVWFAGEIVAASASRHFWPHYFLSAIPALVLLSAFGMRALARWQRAEGQGRATVSLSAIALLIPFERTHFDALAELNAGPDVPREVAAAIQAASGGRRPTLWVTNYQLTGLYSLTNAPLPTRYAVSPHLLSRQSAMIKADPAAEVARVLAGTPEFILIDSSDKFPQWAERQLDVALAGYRQIYEHGTIGVYQAMHDAKARSTERTIG